jgi:hypothetical protein
MDAAMDSRRRWQIPRCRLLPVVNEIDPLFFTDSLIARFN